MNRYQIIRILVFAPAIVFMILVSECAADSTNVNPRPVRFAVLGDRAGTPVAGVYEQVVAEIQRLRPDFVVTVGDMIEGPSEDSIEIDQRWMEYKLIVVEPLSMPIYYTPGNGDIENDIMERLYRQHIGEPYYSFDYGNLHVVVMDNSRYDSGGQIPSEQMAWLIGDLDASRAAACTFVFMHRPFWYHTTADGLADTLHTIFRTYGVDAVFTGHYHSYFSGEYDGIRYTGLGSSGAAIGSDPTDMGYHFGWVTVDSGGIAIAPVKMGAVLPWDDMTAALRKQISRMERLGLVLDDPVLIGENLTADDPETSVTVRNFSADQEIDDSLIWQVPDGWTITPQKAAVRVPPGGKTSVTFQARCAGPLYPVPGVSLSFPFAEGRTAMARADLNIARTIDCPKVSMPPLIDGNIAEPIWKTPATRFFAHDGGAAATDPAAVYFAYDAQTLYIAVRCTDQVMDSVVGTALEHDGPVYNEDYIGFLIQPDPGTNTVYQMYFNPLGRSLDQKAVMGEDGFMTADIEWNGTYDVRTNLGEDSWTIEIAVPLNQFGVTGQPGRKMGLNFWRRQARFQSFGAWQVPRAYDPKTFGIMIMR